jgi:predicted XRE-type DNA-binding protein
MTDELELVRGTDNPFRDVGLPEPDTKLMKADLAAEIMRVLRERAISGAQAAKLTGVQEADISRIRNAQLDRFTIDRLVTILNRLDRGVQVHVTVKPSGAGHPAPVLGAE